MAGNFSRISINNAPSKLSAIALAVAFYVALSLSLIGCSGSSNKAAAPAPVLSALTPNQASVATAIKLTGSNFGTTQTATDAVTFNGKLATVISWSPTAIVTEVPAGASIGNVVVAAGGMVSTGVTFTVTPGTVAGCGSGKESLLSGPYAYVMSGFMGAGLGSDFARAGSFAANGAGLITGGNEDLNVGTLGDTHHTIVGGTYSIGPDDRGCLTLNFGADSATLRFSVGTLSNANVATRGRIIEFDDSSNNGAGFRASGILLQQIVGSNIGSTLLTNYAFGMQGADPTGGHVAMGGTFTLAPALATNNITNGFFDYNDAASLLFAGTSNAAFGTMFTTGANISPTTGRTTATFSAQPACAATTCTYHWAVYVVNVNQLFLISTDTLGANTPLVSGRAISTGSPTSFLASAVSNAGGYILEAGGSITGNAVVQLQQVKFTPTSLSFATSGWTYSVDTAHIVNTPANTAANLTGSYLVSTPGRLAFSNNDLGLVVYLTDPSVASDIAGFVVGVDSTKATAYSGLLIAQKGTALAAGRYFLGNTNILDNTVASAEGAVAVQVTTNTPVASTVGGAVDRSQLSGLSSTSFANEAFTFAATGLGTFTDGAGNTLVGIADGTAFFYITEATTPTPTDPAVVAIIDQ